MAKVSRVIEVHPTWNRPDLAVVSVQATPERARPGQRVALSAIVSNRGTGRSHPATVVFRDDTRIVGRASVVPLTHAQRVTLQASWVARGAGLMLLRAALAIEGRDRDSSNNGASVVVPVVGGRQGAVLRVQPMRGAVEPLLASRERVILPVTIQNRGFAPSEPVRGDLSLDGHSIWQGALESVGAGEQHKLKLPVPVLQAGEHMLRLRLGPTISSVIRAWHVVVPASAYQSFLGSGNLDRWVSVGPDRLDTGSSGRMDSLAFHPKDPHILFAGAAVRGSGGLSKSINSGRTWTSLTICSDR